MTGSRRKGQRVFGGETSAGTHAKSKKNVSLVAVRGERHRRNGVSRGSDGRGDARDATPASPR